MTNQEKRSTENRQPLTREYQWSVTLKTIVNCRIETKPDDPHLTSPWSGIVDKLAESLSSPSPALLRERVRVRVQNLFSLSERCANRCLKARLIVELDSGQLTEEGAVAGPAAYRRTLTRASRLLQRTGKSRAASPSPATERARDLRGAAPDLSLSTLSDNRGRDFRHASCGLAANVETPETAFGRPRPNLNPVSAAEFWDMIRIRGRGQNQGEGSKSYVAPRHGSRRPSRAIKRLLRGIMRRSTSRVRKNQFPYE